MGSYARLNFRVKAETRFGEVVHISGGSFALGKYNPSEARPLVTTPKDYPIWFTDKPIMVPSGVEHTYKYAIFSGGHLTEWESIGERSIMTEENVATIQDVYGVSRDSATNESTKSIGAKTTDEISHCVTVGAVKRGSSSVSDTGVVGSAFSSRASFKTRSLSAPQVPLMLQRSSSSDSFSSRFTPIVEHPVLAPPTAPSPPVDVASRSSLSYPRSSDEVSVAPATAYSRLFIICFHLPVHLTKSVVTNDDGSTASRWSVEWDHSLMAKSDHSVSEDLPTTWIGAISSRLVRGDGEDSASAVRQLSAQDKIDLRDVLLAENCIPVFIDPELQDQHYYGYCKSYLWPAFHNVDMIDIHMAVWNDDQGSFQDDLNGWSDSYKQVQEMFRDTIVGLLRGGEALWIHDYHLMLLPGMIAEATGELREGMHVTKTPTSPDMIFFLHVPFPTTEVFRGLECGAELLDGMLGADVVGFHTFDHARHFLNSCKRLKGLVYQSRQGGNMGVDYFGRNVMVSISHVGIEPTFLTNMVQEAGVVEKIAQMKQRFEGKTVIAGFDVCQRLSGLSHKLLAFEILLKGFPVWRSKVQLVQFVHLPRNRPADEELSLKELRELAGRINESFPDSVVVQEFHDVPDVPLEDRLALCMCADVLMTASIREGLNLIPLEYVYVRDPKLGSSPGVVLVTEFSACRSILNGALRINPWHPTSVASQIDVALTMSPSDRALHRKRDLPFVTSRCASQWTRQVLSDMSQSCKHDDTGFSGKFTDMEPAESQTLRSHQLSAGEGTDFRPLDFEEVAKAFAAAKNRLLILDYGGTLVHRERIDQYHKRHFMGISGQPLPTGVTTALATLTKDSQTTVYICSGLDQDVLGSKLGSITGLGLMSQNGLISQPRRVPRVMRMSFLSGGTEKKKWWAWPWFGIKNKKGGESEAKEQEQSVEPRSDQSAGETDTDTDNERAGREWKSVNPRFPWAGVRAIAEPILAEFTMRTNGSATRIMENCVAWNHRATDPEWGLMMAAKLQEVLEEALVDYDVTVTKKKGLVEILPGGLNKGTLARQVLEAERERLGAHPDFILCCGDDTADEHMFLAIYEYLADHDGQSVAVAGSAAAAAAAETKVGSGASDGAAAAAAQKPAVAQELPPATPTVTFGASAASRGSDGAASDAAAVFTCTVGKKPSHAQTFVNEAGDIAELLRCLAATLKDGCGDGASATTGGGGASEVGTGSSEDVGGGQAGGDVKVDVESGPKVAQEVLG